MASFKKYFSVTGIKKIYYPDLEQYNRLFLLQKDFLHKIRKPSSQRWLSFII